MFDLGPDIVRDEEVEAVLAAALRTGGGGLTRPAECFMATVAARHLVEQMALAGLRVVRVPERLVAEQVAAGSGR